MKKKTKIILLAALMSVVFSVLSVTASAEEAWSEDAIYSTADGENETDVSPTENAEKATVTEEASIFDEIYLRLTENADKIFAALAFVGTMIVSFAYKKGLLPLLGNAIAYLKGSVESIKESGTALAKNTDDRFVSLCENMQSVLEGNTATARSIEKINERLDGFDTMTEKYDTMQVVLNSQIDMLYAIFMSSALPQYQKEEVGNKINRMKEELAKYDKNEE